MATAHTRPPDATEILVLLIVRDQPGLSIMQIESRMGPVGVRSNSEPSRVWLSEQGYLEPFRDNVGKIRELCWDISQLGYDAIDTHKPNALRDLDHTISERSKPHPKDGSTTPNEVKRLKYLRDRVESEELYLPDHEPAGEAAAVEYATPEEEEAALVSRLAAIRRAREEQALEAQDDADEPSGPVRKTAKKQAKKKTSRKKSKTSKKTKARRPNASARRKK